MDPGQLESHAAWVLVITFAISLAYEIWRTATGTTRHDTVRNFVGLGLVLYGSAAVVVAFLFAGTGWSAWVGLVYSVVLIAVSIFYYNPVILPERDPGLIDWVEDLLYTGLLFVAATQLVYAVMGAP